MIRHAAVCISPLPWVDAAPAIVDDVMSEDRGFAAETCA